MANAWFLFALPEAVQLGEAGVMEVDVSQDQQTAPSDASGSQPLTPACLSG